MNTLIFIQQILLAVALLINIYVVYRGIKGYQKQDKLNLELTRLVNHYYELTHDRDIKN